ncbi:MAG: hypothetical protein WBJ68_14125 [Candidatus Dechloromonas phosphoritropha]|jgi:hypothetical protein
MMTPSQIRLAQNPILSSLLLGFGQGTFVAEQLFPRLPQTLSGVTLAQAGDERLKKYNLRRAPGAATKRVDINYAGQTYTVKQYAVEVPIPRELVREADESRRLNVRNHLDISRIAMVTANDILLLDYEIEVATLATTSGTYASGHVTALSGATKWSASTGTPVTDILAASDTIRKKIGKRPNKLTLSADAWTAIRVNAEVKTYLSSTQQGPVSLDQLKSILNLNEVVIGDAVWMDAAGTGADVWGNNAILAYVPTIGGAGNDISLAEPGFGFTNVMEGHPYAESPYYDNSTKSWIYGATYERQANVAYNTAAFLFQNPK